MKENENYLFNIEYTQKRFLGNDDNEKYVSKHFGDIKALDLNSDEEEDVEEIIGKIKIKIFHMGSMYNDNYDPMEVFDLESQDYEIYEKIFNNNGEYKSGIEKNIFSLGLDICVIDRIFIDPEWRGNNITKMIIDDLLIQHADGCKFIVLKSFPLQFEGGDTNLSKKEYKGLETNLKKASSKLSSYYKSLGFINLPKISKDILFLPI